MEKTAKKYLEVTAKTKPEEALDLPKGQLVGPGTFGGYIEVDINPEYVIKCINLIIENNVNKTFYTQAEIIKYAGNNLGWGRGGGYFIP